MKLGSLPYGLGSAGGRGGEEGGFRASGDDANIESPFLFLPFATEGGDDNEIAPEKKETFWIPS